MRDTFRPHLNSHSLSHRHHKVRHWVFASPTTLPLFLFSHAFGSYFRSTKPLRLFLPPPTSFLLLLSPATLSWLSFSPPLGPCLCSHLPTWSLPLLPSLCTSHWFHSPILYQFLFPISHFVLNHPFCASPCSQSTILYQSFVPNRPFRTSPLFPVDHFVPVLVPNRPFYGSFLPPTYSSLAFASIHPLCTCLYCLIFGILAFAPTYSRCARLCSHKHTVAVFLAPYQHCICPVSSSAYLCSPPPFVLLIAYPPFVWSFDSLVLIPVRFSVGAYGFLCVFLHLLVVCIYSSYPCLRVHSPSSLL